MKAETSEKSQSESTTPASTTPTSETASIIDGDDQGETAVSTTLTSDSVSYSTSKDTGGNLKGSSSEDQTKNLVGKLNNLVSTDLNNIVEGRDFLMIGWC